MHTPIVRLVTSIAMVEPMAIFDKRQTLPKLKSCLLQDFTI